MGLSGDWFCMSDVDEVPAHLIKLERPNDGVDSTTNLLIQCFPGAFRLVLLCFGTHSVRKTPVASLKRVAKAFVKGYFPVPYGYTNHILKHHLW